MNFDELYGFSLKIKLMHELEASKSKQFEATELLKILIHPFTDEDLKANERENLKVRIVNALGILRKSGHVTRQISISKTNTTVYKYQFKSKVS